MIESTVNTFTKGLNRDVSPTKYSQENYFDALNVKIITDEALSSFSITNEKGQTNAFNIPTVQAVYELRFLKQSNDPIPITINNIDTTLFTEDSAWTYESICDELNSFYSFYVSNGRYSIHNQVDRIVIVGLSTALTVSTSTSEVLRATRIVEQITDAVIVGSTQLRDYLILLTTSESGLGDGQIWKLRISEDGSVDFTGSNIIGVNNDLDPVIHLVYNDMMNLSVDHRIEAYGNYETPEVGKIYFTDYNNNFRHFNVLAEDTFSVPLSALDIIPEVTFGTTEILEVTDTGSYQSGMVQYAHQYYNLHGSQSPFSPTTGLIHFTKSSEILSNTKRYFGTAVDLNTGKAIRLSISDLDRRFTNVRVVALHYKTLTGTPTITIVEDREIPTSGSIYVTDSGNTIKGTLSDVEFSALGSINFKCKTFDTKDNILFPANIVEDFYDVDEEEYWDSRAYRWDTNGAAILRSEDGTYEYIHSLINATIDEIHDCIQTKEDQRTYKFTKSGTKRLGGEGINVRYYFNTEDVVEESNANDDVPDHINATLMFANKGANNYPNYANPLMHANKVGYMRDEVYRFGIVFIDSNGRKSFVKWIADIKMPSISEVDTDSKSYVTFYKSGNEVKIRILSLTFEVNNIPESAVSFEIVRVKRENSDKTILAQGILSTTVGAGGGVTYYSPHTTPRPISYIAAGSRIFNFLSPEVSFFKDFNFLANLHIIGSLSYIEGGAIPQEFKKVNNLYPSSATTVNTIPIVESRVVPPGYETNYLINNTSYKNYRFDNGDAAKEAGYMCTNLVVGVDSTTGLTTGVAPDTGYALTNIVRTLTSQYGGSSYNNRFNNKYIGCYKENLSDTTVKVYGGDTFINYFDLTYGLFDVTASSDVYDTQVVLMFPVESSINLALRHDYCVTKDVISNNYLIQETAGLQSTAYYAGASYDQTTDLYLYNRAYSRENDITSFFSKPINFSNNKTFDTRILSSEVKKINEEIDSWTSFLATNYVDVDATYGPINKLVTFNRKLLFFQDKALGWAAVNERSLITPDASGTTLSLGKGGILDQYFYISRHSGSKHQFSVIYSPNGVYYYDAANNRVNVFTGEQNEPISELKGFSSYLKQMSATGIRKNDSTLTGLGVHGVYDQRFNRILWTFNDYGYADEFTIGYNEMLKCFESFYSFKPRIYLKFDDYVYSTDPTDLSKGYLHNSGYYGKFYDNTYDSVIEILVNKDPYRAKAFTNFEYILNTTPEEARNFESIRLYNSYQDSGIVLLTDDNSNRRMRVYRVSAPRNAGSDDRIRGEFSLVRFSFDNSLSNVKFVLNDIITHYISKSNI